MRSLNHRTAGQRNTTYKTAEERQEEMEEYHHLNSNTIDTTFFNQWNEDEEIESEDVSPENNDQQTSNPTSFISEDKKKEVNPMRYLSPVDESKSNTDVQQKITKDTGNLFSKSISSCDNVNKQLEGVSSVISQNLGHFDKNAQNADKQNVESHLTAQNTSSKNSGSTKSSSSSNSSKNNRSENTTNDDDISSNVLRSIQTQHNTLFQNAQQAIAMMQHKHKVSSIKSNGQSQESNPEHSSTSLSRANDSSGSTHESNEPNSATLPQSSATRNNSSGNRQSLPPFHLFGAPVELRHSFIQSQLNYNMPPLQDNNSYHYGMTVNGFHPQLNALENPPVLIDSRYIGINNGSSEDAVMGGDSSGKVRNEREQRRAQKITELIENLRLSMLDGGWKVEIKSKYHTLSNCAEYVKHLIKETKEKEKVVEKARKELEEKKLKSKSSCSSSNAIAAKGSRTYSDMSSLTRAGSFPRSSSSSSPVGKSSKHNNDNNPAVGANRKRKSERNNGVSEKKIKKQRDVISADSSEEEAHQLIGHHPSHISFNDPSTVSDLTSQGNSSGSEDSNNNKNSDPSYDKSKSGKVQEIVCRVMNGTCSQSSASSTAAVAPTSTSVQVEVLDKDTLLYEEVFNSSNVPQLIATTAGRIASCNELFFKATGLKPIDLKYLTIFNMVQPDRLPDLFEIVAKALRSNLSMDQNSENSDVCHNISESSSGNSTSTTPTNEKKESEEDSKVRSPTAAGTTTTLSSCNKINSDCSAMTLPCIRFPIENNTTVKSNKEKVAFEEEVNEMYPQLYMTVSLVDDINPEKRFLHCILGDTCDNKKNCSFLSPRYLTQVFV